MTTADALSLGRDLPAAARGDRDAFARLVDGTRSVVASIALAIVRDPDLSRDVAQDVFLAAWRDLAQLRDPQSFLPWLRQTTRHRAYHVLRTERRRAARVTLDDTDTILASAVDASPGTEAAMLADEDARVVRAVLDALPDDTREVVTLFYREGQSSAQVAQLLGISDAAVRKRLSRARDTLRASLLDRFGDVARATAPGAVFTTTVMTALAVGAPSTATAASTSLTAGVGASLGAAKTAAALSAVLLPAAGGLAGVLFGTRQLKRQARSVTELIALGHFELASVALVVVAAFAFPLGLVLTASRWAPVATFAAFIASLAALHTLWLPRIVAARHALERKEDPVAAASARARERRIAILGWTAGIVCGTLGLLCGLFVR
ncbi:MAG: sigma-70 family RNA polymerase sigma factor [Vicinamibacteraceae bacterium]